MLLEMKLHVLETNEPMLNRKYQVHSNIRSGLMLKCSSGTKIENVQDSTQKKNLIPDFKCCSLIVPFIMFDSGSLSAIKDGGG